MYKDKCQMKIFTNYRLCIMPAFCFVREGFKIKLIFTKSNITRNNTYSNLSTCLRVWTLSSRFPMLLVSFSLLAKLVGILEIEIKVTKSSRQDATLETFRLHNY